MTDFLQGSQTGPRIYFYESVTSTFDKSFELIARGSLQVWDSVLAASQTNGRGQMRRFWASPAGNLHASLRLPLVPPFNASGAAVAASVLCMLALRQLGLDIKIKWPNDLVMAKDGKVYKAGGIMLEEHSYSLVAGIGINIGIAPDISREKWDLPIIRLMDVLENDKEAKIGELWASIVKNMINDYNSPSFSTGWQQIGQESMIWLGRKVTIRDGGELCRGILAGLSEEGRIMLQTRAGMETWGSGLLALDEQA